MALILPDQTLKPHKSDKFRKKPTNDLESGLLRRWPCILGTLLFFTYLWSQSLRVQMKQGSVFCCCFTHRFTCSRSLSPCGPPGACPSFWKYCLIFLISRTRFLALYSCAKISARNASDVEAVEEVVDDIVPADEASITEVACVDDPPNEVISSSSS